VIYIVIWVEIKPCIDTKRDIDVFGYSVIVRDVGESLDIHGAVADNRIFTCPYLMCDVSISHFSLEITP
jgi:hypothetical protein